MTDNEVLQALDSVGTANGVVLGPHSGQADIIADRFRELISENGHLKAEIEKKQKVLDEVLELAEMGLAGIEDHDRRIKSEAIKEFAERLKVEIICDTAYGCDCNQHIGYYDYKIKIGDIPEYIDDIVKKLTEEK